MHRQTENVSQDRRAHREGSLPSIQELRKLPLRALVNYACRAAQRPFSLINREPWGEIAEAIQIAKEFASDHSMENELPSDVRHLANRVFAVALRLRDSTESIGAYAAACAIETVVHAARAEAKFSQGRFTCAKTHHGHALYAAHDASVVASAAERAFIHGCRADYEHLRALAEQGSVKVVSMPYLSAPANSPSR